MSLAAVLLAAAVTSGPINVYVFTKAPEAGVSAPDYSRRSDSVVSIKSMIDGRSVKGGPKIGLADTADGADVVVEVAQSFTNGVYYKAEAKVTAGKLTTTLIGHGGCPFSDDLNCAAIEISKDLKKWLGQNLPEIR